MDGRNEIIALKKLRDSGRLAVFERSTQGLPDIEARQVLAQNVAELGFDSLDIDRLFRKIRAASDTQTGPAGHQIQKTAARPMPEGFFAGDKLDNDPTGINRLVNAEEGYIVGRLGDQMLRLKTDRHLITIGPTGSGKGTGCIIPNLCDHPGSAVVVDIRGETVQRTADARLLMGQNVVVLDPYGITEGRWGYDALNPLQFVDPNALTFHADVANIAKAFMYDAEGRSSNEPIWDDSTLKFFESNIEFIRRYLPPERQNLTELANIYLLSSKEREEYAEAVRHILEAEANPTELAGIRRLYAFLTESAEKTKIPDNARVSGDTKTAWALDRPFRPLLANTTFDLSSIQSVPTTIYIVVEERYLEERCAIWVRLVLQTIFNQLHDVVKLFGMPSNQIPMTNRVLFLLDEFPSFGRLDVVLRKSNVVRGNAANIWMFLQHMGQLDDLYGEHNAQTIVGNTAIIQALGSGEINQLEYYSKIVGEEMFDVPTVSIGASVQEGNSRTVSDNFSVTNTESVSKGYSNAKTYTTQYGKSLTDTEGRTKTATVGVSESKGRTMTHGDTHTKGVGSSESRGEGDAHTVTENASSGSAQTFGMMRWDSSRNESQGFSNALSHNRNYSRSSNTSVSDSETNSEAINTSKQNSQSEAISKSESHAVTTSESESEGMTESSSHQDTTSESITHGHGQSQSEQRTKGININVSVKSEQQPIATPRNLERLFSDNNQLIKVTGRSAFMTPKMSYLARDRSTGCLLFPGLAILAHETTFTELGVDLFRRMLPNDMKDRVTDYESLHQAYEEYSGIKTAEEALSDQDISVDEIKKTVSVLGVEPPGEGIEISRLLRLIRESLGVNKKELWWHPHGELPSREQIDEAMQLWIFKNQDILEKVAESAQGLSAYKPLLQRIGAILGQWCAVKVSRHECVRKLDAMVSQCDELIQQRLIEAAMRNISRRDRSAN